jgi:hypothetical protein
MTEEMKEEQRKWHRDMGDRLGRTLILTGCGELSIEFEHSQSISLASLRALGWQLSAATHSISLTQATWALGAP